MDKQEATTMYDTEYTEGVLGDGAAILADGERLRVGEIVGLLRVHEQLLRQRQGLLDLLPDCPTHGPDCIPHMMEWVTGMLASEKLGMSQVSTGHDRLCVALYQRKPKSADLVGGSHSRLLHNAASVIEEAGMGMAKVAELAECIPNHSQDTHVLHFVDLLLAVSASFSVPEDYERLEAEAELAMTTQALASSIAAKLYPEAWTVDGPRLDSNAERRACAEEVATELLPLFGMRPGLGTVGSRTKELTAALLPTKTT